MRLKRPLSARWYAALAVGWAAFTLYGSYVPFNYHPLPWGEAVELFDHTVRATLWPLSKSDWVANWLLGVPLGFCVLAAFRVDRDDRLATLAVAAAVVPTCLTFAACVEFGQLYFPGRSCTGADIWAQGLGSTCGVVAWLVAGQRFTLAARRTLDRTGGAVNLLLAYGFLAMVSQTLPFDITVSPTELYQRLKSDKVTVVPLRELASKPGHTAADDWKKAAAWCELLAVAAPGGLLLSGLAGRWRSVNSLGRVAVVGLLAGFALELAQWPIQSRHPSTTDVLVIAFGVVVGWAVGLAAADKGARKYRAETAVVLAQLWFAVLAVHHWQPFVFRPPLVPVNAARISWVPFEQQTAKQYLWGLEEVFHKVWLFVPLGAVAAWGWVRSAERRAVSYAVGVCLFAAAVLEVGQLALPGRVASPTDLLFAGFGGWVGAFVTVRLAVASRPLFAPRAVRPIVGDWWVVAPSATADAPPTQVPPRESR